MRTLKTWKHTLAAGLIATLTFTMAACSTAGKTPEAGKDAKADKKLTIVATTGYLGDAARNIAPDAEVIVLVGPGGDPHTQPLTTQDTEKLNSADVVLWTSHDMEHQMMGQLEKLGDKQIAAAEAIPEADLLPWEEDGVVEGHDPHVWNSPDSWKYVVTASAKKIAEIDKENADTYLKNAEAYNQKIDEIKAKAKTELDKIPAENRVLITGHDAFNYLGKEFNIEIHATDFVSSEAQITAADLDELAKLIAEKKIPVIFQDNLANPGAIKHLKEAVKAKGWEVEISDKELYADSLGEAAPVDTYLGVFEYNVNAIVEALTPKK
ncbi:zinc ABC transporter substrate-binding protein [Gleimia sp. 6138-11-ORH1]|uniref:metal ABC transporter substrate-binding protein n=1 Tax=Gleimia sp. 6138-11-ORH1 TaxID=2973937 RepID=UPI0021687B11|nr:zinc ABC transporter substrate-binding protein [Gleimia sp. 6138-11-ORH1]MCS4485072.1 zinc ABC transporter substrate-binding protein [Gleimia sp. 6138-11-ORH1]